MNFHTKLNRISYNCDKENERKRREREREREGEIIKVKQMRWGEIEKIEITFV